MKTISGKNYTAAQLESFLCLVEFFKKRGMDHDLTEAQKEMLIECIKRDGKAFLKNPKAKWDYNQRAVFRAIQFVKNPMHYSEAWITACMMASDPEARQLSTIIGELA